MQAVAPNGELTTGSAASTEFQALISGCAVYRLSSRAKIRLTGNDRVRWLNGMITNNIRDLAVGRGVYGFLLNPQGRILGDLYAYNRGDSLWLDTDEGQTAKILEIFDHYIIMDDVQVENISRQITAIGLSGPKSMEILRSTGIDVSNMQPLELRDLQWKQLPLTVVRSEHEKRESHEVWVAAARAAEVRDALLQHGGIATNDAALEVYRVALGLPRYGQDIRERDLPQETRQTRALNFSKGCYVGQEIVERIRSRGAVHRTFTGFAFENGLPSAGSKIQIDGKDVGEITSVAALPLQSGTQNVALGYIRREVASTGKAVMVEGTNATVAELPFKAVFG